MPSKLYAIKEGIDPKTKERVQNKIVSTWAECLSHVKGVKGAKYKSFTSLEEAKEYLKDDKKLFKKGVDSYPEEGLHLYVDGSYHSATEKYAFAFVAVKENTLIHMEHGIPQDTSQKQLRQIAGELQAAVKAVEYAAAEGEKKIVLFHDYEGIFHHAVGTWERKDASSKAYYDKMNELIEKHQLQITFVKVDSHTGDIFNEITDNYAKIAIGVPVTSAVNQWLSSNLLFVQHAILKEEVMKLVSKSHEDKIIVQIAELGKKLSSTIQNRAQKQQWKAGTEILLRLQSILTESEIAALEYLENLEPKLKDQLLLQLVKTQKQ